MHNCVSKFLSKIRYNFGSCNIIVSTQPIRFLLYKCDKNSELLITAITYVVSATESRKLSNFAHCIFFLNL